MNWEADAIKKNIKIPIIIICSILIVILTIYFRYELLVVTNNVSGQIYYSTNSVFFGSLHRLTSDTDFISSEDSKYTIVEKITTLRKEAISIPNIHETLTSNSLSEDITINFKGIEGENTYSIVSLVNTKSSEAKSRVVNEVLTKTIDPINPKIIKGSLTAEQYSIQLKSNLEQKLDYIEKIITEQNQPQNLSIELHEIKLSDAITFVPKEKEQFATLGYAHILYPNCNYFIEIPILYFWSNDSIEFQSLHTLIKFNCDDSVKYPTPVRMETCDDCLLARVDKTVRLPSWYSPKELTNMNDQGFEDFEIDSRVKPDLIDLLTAAKAAGHKVSLTSTYRSFTTQQEVFKYWVDREIRLFGYDQSKAEEKANTFSARPGFSEHQLGTTVDINSIECDGFDGYCQQNEDLWKWLSGNAVTYGFVLSYPKGKDDITGYIHEPWHYRWLGKDLAVQYVNDWNSERVTLNIWLDNLSLKSLLP